MTLSDDSYGSAQGAYIGGVRDCFGAPVLVLVATYVGFGSLVRSLDLPLAAGLVSTLTAWAIPGQIALVELYVLGAPLLAIAATVAATNLRLLPMVLALFPKLRSDRWPTWIFFGACIWVAITGWLQAMQRTPSLPEEERLPYFVGFSSTIWIATLFATAAGWFLADGMPPIISLGLVFLNPIYFMLVLSADLADRGRRMAMLLGAVAGPAFHLVDPYWALPATGLVMGTVAFLLTREGERGA